MKAKPKGNKVRKFSKRVTEWGTCNGILNDPCKFNLKDAQLQDRLTKALSNKTGEK